jgi:hypothetical protein
MGGGQPAAADRPMPRYRPAPEYPLLPDYQPLPDDPGGAPGPGHRPMPAEQPADCWLPDVLAAPGRPPLPDDPPVPGYRLYAAYPPCPVPPPAPGHRPVPGYPAAPAYLSIPVQPPVPRYPAVPPYLSVRDCPPVPDWPAAPAPGYRALLRRLAGLVPRQAAAGRAPGRMVAAAGYLTVPVFVVPLVIYLGTLRGPAWVRGHAAQALNVWLTGTLYDLAAAIMGAMLALDSPRVALAVFVPLVAARWLVTLGHLARAARAASRGADYAVSSWLCMRVAR